MTSRADPLEAVLGRQHPSRSPADYKPGRSHLSDYRGQVQSGPQLHVSPHRHPARRSSFAAWQPQVQVAPGQDAHEQAFEVVVLLVLFGMTGSFEGG